MATVARLAALAAVVAWLAVPAAIVGQERPEGLHVRASVEYYDVAEETLSEVSERLNRMRLEGAAGPLSQGLTRYHIRPVWRAVAGGGRCRAEDVEMFVEVTITLPRWPAASTRPAEERARWSEIAGAIRTHEFGHRDLTIDAAEALLTTTKALEAQGCDTLQRVVESTLSVADGRLRDAHAELDSATPERLRVGPGGG
jgi:predicted secreted Zn-dependent protease